jgi:AraC-like DNA-binding protein
MASDGKLLSNPYNWFLPADPNPAVRPEGLVASLQRVLNFKTGSAGLPCGAVFLYVVAESAKLLIRRKNMGSAGKAGHEPEMDGDHPGLSEPSLITLEYYQQPEALQPFITTLYSLHGMERDIRDVMPAGMGFLQIFLRGSGTLEFYDGRIEGPSRINLITPTSAASIAHLEGPFIIIGAALSPVGWAALLGLAADKHRDHLYDGIDYFGPDLARLADDLVAMLAKDPANLNALAQQLAAFIGARLKPVNSRHLQLIAHIGDWISSAFDPPLSDLERRAAYSGRQLQRLTERYFGLSPKGLIRKYRVLRVAALLQSPETSDERVAELINLFYDQSHLIREMRHFLGRTPTRLVSGHTPLLAAASGLRNYREVKPNFARIPED